MSILDDAIREHLELKRAHGADESELKKLEDEAFGPPARPDEIDPFAEAPTEFLGVPEGETQVVEPDEGGRRIPNIADLQEAPPPQEEAAPEAPVVPGDEVASEAPAEEQQPASEQELPEPASESDDEHEAPVADASHTMAERNAIADQPTEFFDVEAVMGSEPDTADRPSPTDEDIVDAEIAAPRLAPVEDPGLVDDSDDDEFDEFFSEQRLSDELNQALEAPITEEHPVEESAPPVAEPEPEPDDREEAPDSDQSAFFDQEQGHEEHEDEDAEEPQEPASESRPKDHEDVLEDTPDFLEDTPEDDDLWFEQRPPKDFDFDD